MIKTLVWTGLAAFALGSVGVFAAAKDEKADAAADAESCESRSPARQIPSRHHHPPLLTALPLSRTHTRAPSLLPSPPAHFPACAPSRPLPSPSCPPPLLAPLLLCSPPPLSLSPPPLPPPSAGPIIGIDLGTTYSCVGVYQKGRVDIIPNDQGNRITPSYVAWDGEERLVGDAAKNQATINPTTTVFDAKRLIGRSFTDKTVQDDMKHWPFKVANKNSRPMIEIPLKDGVKQFAAEEISAMVLSYMKKIAEVRGQRRRRRRRRGWQRGGRARALGGAALTPGSSSRGRAAPRGRAPRAHPPPPPRSLSPPPPPPLCRTTWARR
jgi:hypothetical protein